MSRIARREDDKDRTGLLEKNPGQQLIRRAEVEA